MTNIELLKAMEELLDQKLEQKLIELEQRLEEKLEQKLEEKLEQKLEQKLDEKLDQKLDEKLDQKLEPIHRDIAVLKEEVAELKKSDAMILDELERVHEIMLRRTDELKAKIG